MTYGDAFAAAGEEDWSPSDSDWSWYLEETYCDPYERDYL